MTCLERLLNQSTTSLGRCTADERDVHGRTALHLAARHGRNESVRILVKYGSFACVLFDDNLVVLGADVNARDTINNNTPLHYAAKHGHHMIIR